MVSCVDARWENISYSYGWNGDRNEEVADAVAKIAPELSVKVWEKKIAANCEKPDRSCYANIGAALRKLRPLLEGGSGKIADE